MRIVRYRVADPGRKVALNRLCGKVIGIYVVAGKYCFSLVWKR